MAQKILDTNQLTIADEIKRGGYLYEILSMLIEVQNNAGHGHGKRYDYSIDTYVDYALQYIHLNYAHIKVQDIATSVGYNNPLSFSKIFKQEYGFSPRHYRENKKETE